MTMLECPVRNAQDMKVIFVGLICTIFIFSVVTIGENIIATPMNHVDLVKQK